jgi:23S rRNA pseudouridine1911/1915/1917 synthase
VLNQPDFVVIDKPRSLPTIATNDNIIENALHQTSELIGQKLWSVHRLDHPTSGCLIFAKSSNACSVLNKSWAACTKKYYSLLAQAERPDPPVLPIAGSKITHSMDTTARGVPKPISDKPEEERGIDKECSLILESYESLGTLPGSNLPRAFAKVQLLTGRTHQIRTQFAQLGWPLEHDILYREGFDRDYCELNGIDYFDPDLSLRCYRLKFEYQGQQYDVELETGPDF